MVLLLGFLCLLGFALLPAQMGALFGQHQSSSAICVLFLHLSAMNVLHLYAFHMIVMSAVIAEVEDICKGVAEGIEAGQREAERFYAFVTDCC